MTAEGWAAVIAAMLLAAAFVGGSLAKGRRWPWLVLGLRAGAAAALVLAVVWLAMAQGFWSAADGRQVAAGLALSVVVVNLLLGVWHPSMRTGGAGPAADALAAGLALCIVLLPAPDATLQRPAILSQVGWILTLLGAGTLGVAGSTALTLGVRAALVSRGRGALWPPRANLHDFMYRATALACVALGAGLTIAVWWAWRTSGSPDGGDPRQVWAAAATVLAVASLWAARLGRQSGRWSAALAGVAAVLALTGLLAGVDVQQAMTF